MQQNKEKNIGNDKKIKKNSDAVLEDELTLEELKETSGGKQVLVRKDEKFQ